METWIKKISYEGPTGDIEYERWNRWNNGVSIVSDIPYYSFVDTFFSEWIHLKNKIVVERAGQLTFPEGIRKEQHSTKKTERNLRHIDRILHN